MVAFEAEPPPRIYLTSEQGTQIIIDMIGVARSDDNCQITNLDVILPVLYPGVATVAEVSAQVGTQHTMYGWVVVFSDDTAAVKFKLRYADVIGETD